MKGSQRFRIDREIADTLQGRIYSGTDLITNKRVVIKEAWRQLVDSGRSRKGHRVPEDFIKERKLIMTLTSRNDCNEGIVKGIDEWDDQHCYYYVMEYCEGELFDYISKIHTSSDYKQFMHIESRKEQIPMNKPNKWVINIAKIFKKICLAVQWLHLQGYCHLDLSLENTMIADLNNLKVKIIDFGLMQQFPNHDFRFQGRVGKLQYMCPEAYVRQTYDAKAADVYCLAVMLFMMLIGAPPYQAPQRQNAAFNYFINGRVGDVLKHWKRLRLITNDALDLLNKMFRYQNERITLDQVLIHPFVANLDEEKPLQTENKNNMSNTPLIPSTVDQIPQNVSNMSLEDNGNNKKNEPNKNMYGDMLLQEWGLEGISSQLYLTGWSNPKQWDQLDLNVLKFEIGLNHNQAITFLNKYKQVFKHQKHNNPKNQHNQYQQPNPYNQYSNYGHNNKHNQVEGWVVITNDKTETGSGATTLVDQNAKQTVEPSDSQANDFDQQVNMVSVHKNDSDIIGDVSTTNSTHELATNDMKIEPEEVKNKNAEQKNDQTVVQPFNDDTVRNLLISSQKLLNLANQWKTNEMFQTALSSNPVIVEYATGNESNDSPPIRSDASGDSKRNSDDENGNNSNGNRQSDDNNHNDDDNKDNNDEDENKDGSCMMHKYDCNVPWHSLRLKQLGEENRTLKLLLQNQTTDANISQSCVNSVNAKESKRKAKINLKITAKLTKKEIPERVDETFCDVFDFMNKYIHIHHENASEDYKCDEGEIKVIDYGINDKKTQEILYVVCAKKNGSNGVLTSWKTSDDLYSAATLKQIYNITKQNLSFPVTISDEIIAEIKNAKEQVIHLLRDKTQRDNIIQNKKTPWGNGDKIPIFNKTPKQTGLTLVLEKHEFVERVKTFADKNVNDIKLVPIVRFNNENKYFYEIAWIVEIGENINIAISFKHINNNKYLPSAIYLDIHDQHKLVAYKHDCECLAAFNCIIDRLQIGDCDKTRMHQSYKSKMEEKIEEYENQMQNYLRLRQEDMLIIDNMKQTCANLQGDLQSLLDMQNSVNQQQKTCNRLHALNALNALQLNPESSPLHPFQSYDDQLTTQINNLNHNQQQ